MTENSVAQFSRLARELLNIRSEEWNTTRISNKNRLSSYLFFLRNRGHDLLRKVVEEHEPVNDPEFIDLILHTVVCLCRLPAQNLPLIEQKLDRRNRTVSKSQRKKESKKVKCEKRPMIKPLHRVLQSALTDEDKDHDYSVILANSTAIIHRVSYPGILYLRPITDLLRNFAAAHGDRVKIAFLIALINNLREQITCDRVVIEDGSQTVKMMMEIITLAKLLLLDGEDSLGLNVILILINILRRVQLDHLFSASWSYMLNLKLLELTPLSNFTNIPVLKDVLEQIHSAELVLRRRINSILSGNNCASAVFPIQHWNGEQAEKQFSLALQTKELTSDQSSEICLFAKFTKAMLVLINICSADLLDVIKNLLSQSYNCCCVPLADIFSKINEQRFSFLPYLLARCEQPKCPRCVTRDCKIWAPLSHYSFSKINSEDERINYFATIHHLTSVLPKNANRLLLDNLLLPILSQNLDQLGRSSDNESKLHKILDSIGNTLSSITFAPLGLFKTFLKMLKKIDVDGTKMVLPIITSSMKVSTSNQVESLEQQKLAKEIILIFCRSTKAVLIDDVGNIKMENDQPILEPSEAILTTDCLFYLTQLYEGIAHSDLLRKAVFKNLRLKEVIKNLLGQSICLVGDPSIVINAASDSSYISIPKHNTMPLTTRIEIFSVLLGLYTFFTSHCPLQWPDYESAFLPEIASDFVSKTSHLKMQVIPCLTKVLEASLEPRLKTTKISPRKNHRRNRSILLDVSAFENSSEAPLVRNPPPESSPSKNTRKVIFPCVIKIVFTIFGLFWEDTTSTEELPGLVPLLEMTLSLLNSQKNVEICAKHNVVLLVLEKFNFLLDTEENKQITKLILELFSKSSRHYVSPAALQLVLQQTHSSSSSHHRHHCLSQRSFRDDIKSIRFNANSNYYRQNLQQPVRYQWNIRLEQLSMESRNYTSRNERLFQKERADLVDFLFLDFR
ncbi:unnamed protein product [Oikopleura dioica]|uniref:Uncharacterized protein n=2 Tax=Oikopleura dioica TaxID=34765 RepID=E4XJY4_OIKDI|nr:unnamed protein product [Oikopleura dioica]